MAFPMAFHRPWRLHLLRSAAGELLEEAPEALQERLSAATWRRDRSCGHIGVVGVVGFVEFDDSMGRLKREKNRNRKPFRFSHGIYGIFPVIVPLSQSIEWWFSKILLNMIICSGFTHWYPLIAWWLFIVSISPLVQPLPGGGWAYPSWKIGKSIGRMKFERYGKIKMFPNQEPIVVEWWWHLVVSIHGDSPKWMLFMGNRWTWMISRYLFQETSISHTYSLVNWHNYGKSPCSMETSTINGNVQ